MNLFSAYNRLIFQNALERTGRENERRDGHEARKKKIIRPLADKKRKRLFDVTLSEDRQRESGGVAQRFDKRGAATIQMNKGKGEAWKYLNAAAIRNQSANETNLSPRRRIKREITRGLSSTWRPRDLRSSLITEEKEKENEWDEGKETMKEAWRDEEEKCATGTNANWPRSQERRKNIKRKGE